MLRLRKHSSKKVGTPQGTLVHVGKKYSDKTKISLTQYTREYSKKTKIESIEECIKLLDDDSVFWLDVTGVHDTNTIQSIGDSFGISSLTLEEIMNTTQYPKIEEFQNYLFVVARTFFYGQTSRKVKYYNISIIIGKNFVITFQEKENELFKPIEDRIRNESSLLRKKKNDYLFCSLLDIIVDQYFPTVEHIENKIESIEAAVTDNPNEKLLHDVYQLRQEVVVFSKIVRSERELLNTLLHKDKEFIETETIRYIHDVYEHVIHLLETLDSYRENITGLHELYLSTISNKMNEVMKTLTVIASIFIPLTFIAGIYGMNFQYIPELGLHDGYFIILSIMVLVAVMMTLFFKKKGWI